MRRHRADRRPTFRGRCGGGPGCASVGIRLALDALALLTVVGGGGSGLADASGGVGRDAQLLEQVRGARVGLDRIRDTEIESLVDELPARHVVPVDEGDRDTGASGATGTADAVDVGLLVLGALIVDDVGDVVDVDAAGGDVRRDEDVDLAAAELVECLLACDLTEVAVHRAARETALDEVVGHLLRRALGAGEDHGGATSLGLQHAGDELGLVERVRPVDELLGALVHGR